MTLFNPSTSYFASFVVLLACYHLQQRHSQLPPTATYHTTAVVEHERKEPSDSRTIIDIIAAGEAQAFKMIWKVFPGNQSRAESMAKTVAASSQPVTR